MSDHICSRVGGGAGSTITVALVRFLFVRFFSAAAVDFFSPLRVALVRVDDLRTAVFLACFEVECFEVVFFFFANVFFCVVRTVRFFFWTVFFTVFFVFFVAAAFCFVAVCFVAFFF
jgi:hypothetical protein